MKKAHFALGLFAVLLLSGCLNPPMSDAVPEDLEITYSYGACHAEWGRTDIAIKADGSGVYESGSGMMIGDRFANEEFRKTFRLSETELLNLLNAIEKSGFYSLGDYYTDPNTIDGSCEYVSVTKNNSTKSVSVSNTEPPAAYGQVAGMISAVAESKT
ncbi:hypothetical protein H0O02_01760 [Candidatus Micrarchaeota archaeon]|nr:hypothetical protein [Candidatus Micrarchaeota archaeon]